MNEHKLEPGLLSVFGLYIVVRLGVILSSGAFYFVWYGFSFDPKVMPYVVLFIGDIVFLIMFLGWPWLQRKLGRSYLPLALIVASLIPIVEARSLYTLYGDNNAARLWLVFPFLSVPLILTAWQYPFRYVVIYCTGTAIFEFGWFLLAGTHLSSMAVLAEGELIVARSVFFTLIGYIVSNLVAAQRQQRADLGRANRKLVRYAATLERLTVVRERNRLARELHDTVAHTLSGLAVELDAIATIWDRNPTRAKGLLNHALATTREGLEDTRRALHALRAAPLDGLGLAFAVRGLGENMASRMGLDLDLRIDEPLRDLDPEVEQCYYRVAQEAIQNVVRHAAADTLRVSLTDDQGHLVLEVSDDGRGFDVDDAHADSRLGLQGMRERADLIGANLVVESRPSQGTTVRLEVHLS